MSTLYSYNKQQFNNDVSFNNTATQINSTGIIGISGGIINISGGTINIDAGGSGNMKISNLGTGTTSTQLYIDNTSGLITKGNAVAYSSITQLNNNIGIGTATPAYKLDVVGNANVSGSFNSLMYITTKSFSFNSQTGSQSTSQFIGKIFNGGLITVYIKSAGYGHGEGSIAEIFCGYGTQPVVRVVSGHLSTYRFYCILNGGTTYLWFNEYGNSANQNIAYECRIYCNNPSDFYPSTTDGYVPSSATEITNGQFILGNGNVGIGTTNPQYKLDVNGSTNLGGGANIQGGYLSIFGGNGLTINSNGPIYNGSGSITCGPINNQGNSVSCGHMTCYSINTQGNTLSCGHMTCYSINTQGNTLSCGPINCSSISATSTIYTPSTVYCQGGVYTYGSNITCGRIDSGGINVNGDVGVDYIGGFFFYAGGGYTGGAGGAGFYVSIRTNNSVHFGDRCVASEFDALSDTRIKTNIIDIDDNKALSILRKIQPKTYEYVDKFTKGNDSVIGFIAQEIKEIIPKAVTIIKDYIPNFYTVCQVTSTDVSNIVLVTSPIDLSWNPLHGSANASNASDQSGNAFIDAAGNACSDASGNKVFNVKLYDQSNNIIKCKTTNVLDKRSFLMDISGTKMVDASGNILLEKDGGYFLYGQEIDDFHTIDKNAIFTVVTAAVQDIDRTQQAQQVQIQSDSAKISALEQQVASLQSLIQLQNAAFEARLASLESK